MYPNFNHLGFRSLCFRLFLSIVLCGEILIFQVFHEPIHDSVLLLTCFHPFISYTNQINLKSRNMNTLTM